MNNTTGCCRVTRAASASARKCEGDRKRERKQGRVWCTVGQRLHVREKNKCIDLIDSFISANGTSSWGRDQAVYCRLSDYNPHSGHLLPPGQASPVQSVIIGFQVRFFYYTICLCICALVNCISIGQGGGHYETQTNGPKRSVTCSCINIPTKVSSGKPQITMRSVIYDCSIYKKKKTYYIYVYLQYR